MPLRLVMMGTGPFAVPTFEALLQSPHRVELLVTRPPVVGKGHGTPAPNPMRTAAEAHQLPVYAPPDINAVEARDTLAALAPDVLVVCDYGQILKNETLAAARLGGINLHGSLLPKYRGAAPINWAIWRGEVETGVTVIHMTPQLDGGPLLAVRTVPIGPQETAAELEPRLARLGVEPVLEALQLLTGWDGRSPLGERQDPQLACKAPRLKKADGLIDWTQSARQIHNQFRALQPWPGTYTFWLRTPGQPLRLVLDAVEPLPADAAGGGAVAGTVVAAGGERLVVATGEGLLAIGRLQPAGKRILTTAEFLRGYAVTPGQRFGAA